MALPSASRIDLADILRMCLKVNVVSWKAVGGAVGEDEIQVSRKGMNLVCRRKSSGSVRLMI